MNIRCPVAGVTKVDHEVVSVHSRGGSVISRLMDQDASGKLLRANRLEMYDSLYGSQWDERAHVQDASARLKHETPHRPAKH